MGGPGGGGDYGFSQFVHSSTKNRDPDQGAPVGSGACVTKAFLFISWMERVG
jgi:hypothetical protein